MPSSKRKRTVSPGLAIPERSTCDCPQLPSSEPEFVPLHADSPASGEVLPLTVSAPLYALNEKRAGATTRNGPPFTLTFRLPPSYPGSVAIQWSNASRRIGRSAGAPIGGLSRNETPLSSSAMQSPRIGSAANAADPGRPSGSAPTRAHVPPSYVAGFAIARVPAVHGASVDSKSENETVSTAPAPLHRAGAFGSRMRPSGHGASARSSTAATASATAAQSAGAITSLEVAHVPGPVVTAWPSGTPTRSAQLCSTASAWSAKSLTGVS